jgi:hypothetical protein
MRRLGATVLVLAALGLLAYATLVPHAQRPCVEPHLTKACKNFLRTSGK